MIAQCFTQGPELFHIFETKLSSKAISYDTAPRYKYYTNY